MLDDDTDALAAELDALIDTTSTVEDALAERTALPYFDYLSPTYQPIWVARAQRLSLLVDDPQLLHAYRINYKTHVADFISDWGVTVNPKNVGTVRPVVMPFRLFPRQREFVDWVIARWTKKQNGVLVKSRECGASRRR